VRPSRLAALVALCVTLAVGGTALWQRGRIAAVVENWKLLRVGAEQARAADSADALAAWMSAHPHQVSWASWTPGEPEGAHVHRADQAVPVARTMTLLVLAEYARQVVAGQQDPDAAVPLAEWEALYLPGTDGRAHRTAVEQLRERGGLQKDEATLRDLAFAMIVHGDNAACDLLMLRLGRPAVESTSAWLGLKEPPALPLTGSLLLARHPPRGMLPAAWMAQLEARGRAHIEDASWALTRRLRDDAAFAQAERDRLEADGLGLTPAEQVLYARALGPQGTARGYAALMARVLEGKPDPAWAKVMAESLEGPRSRSERLREQFHRFGSRGGSLPGVLASASYAQPKDGAPRVLALFFQDLPIALWAQLMRRNTQQELERRLLSDPQ
jgi:D-alanyl-D-alanine carboxypeptidase